MKITVIVQGHSVEYFPEEQFPPDHDGPYEFELGEAMTVRQFLETVGVNPLLVMAVIVDGKRMDKDFHLYDGADVILLAPLAGG